jgi:hypothetical protein
LLRRIELFRLGDGDNFQRFYSWFSAPPPPHQKGGQCCYPGVAAMWGRLSGLSGFSCVYLGRSYVCNRFWNLWEWINLYDVLSAVIGLINLFILGSFRLFLPAAWLSWANHLFLVAQYKSKSLYLRRVLRVIVSGLSIP